jgi:hypothetical protein
MTGLQTLVVTVCWYTSLILTVCSLASSGKEEKLASRGFVLDNGLFLLPSAPLLAEKWAGSLDG